MMDIRLTSLLLVAFVCMNAIYAQSTYTNQIFMIPGWWGLAVAGLGLSVMIIALSFMIGEATGLANIKAFAKEEVYELVATIIVIVIILASLQAYGIFAKDISRGNLIDSGGGQGYSLSGVCTENEKIFDTSDALRPESYLFAQVDWFLGCLPITDDSKLYAQTMREQEMDPNILPYDNLWEAQKGTFGDHHSKGVMLGHMMNIYMGLFSLEFLLGPVSTFGISAYAPEPLISSISIDMAPMSGLTPVSEAMIMLTDMIGVGLVIITVQKVILQYIYHNAIAVFLPVGIAFKAIPFLRKTGATIIAASLVLYFIFPMSLWINEQIYFNSMFSYDETTGAYKSDLIEWTNYNSILELCSPEAGETYAEYESRLLTENIEPFYEETRGLNDFIIGDIGSGDFASRLPKAQHRAMWDAFTENSGTVLSYFFHYASILGPVLPMEYFFSAIVDTFTTGTQWFVLNLLFLVNSIILSVTFFKDLSIAIGGEPRIFGMSKLV